MTRTTFNRIRDAIAARFSRFTWSVPSQHYTGANGRTVPPESVRVVVDKQIAATGKRLEKAGEALAKLDRGAGWEKAVRAWGDEFKDEIRALHLQAGSLGHGGLHAADAEALGRIEDGVAGQFDFHDSIIQRLIDEPEYADSARFRGHGDGYARTARHTYENERQESHRGEGYGWQHRWTHAINSCGQCKALEDEGWVEIGSQPGLGECECGPGCDCTIEYSRGNPDA